MEATKTIYIDSETSGLDSDYDELLEIAIVDDDGKTLLNTLLKPTTQTEWSAAQRIHGISPDDVKDAPLLKDISNQITAIVKGRDIVIYNADFDCGFLGSLLDSARSIQCCMLAWAEHYGDWSEYHGNYRWQKLINAADSVRFQWPYSAHSALADALACRAVWRYLSVPEERKRVDAIYEEEKFNREVKYALRQFERIDEEARHRLEKKSKYMNWFMLRWWIGRTRNLYWTDYCSDTYVVEFFSNLFFGEPSDSNIYIRQKDIPANLKPASYFPKIVWFQSYLKSCAEYLGPDRSWALYDISEMERVSALHPLRFASPENEVADDEVLLNKTQLKIVGFKNKDIKLLNPVAERQNPVNFVWYYLYKVKKSELNCTVDELLKKYRLRFNY